MYCIRKFPDICAVAKLKPLYKKGSLTEPCSYRPISLLPIISKVIEKVIHDQTSTFLNSKNFLYIYQSGFRKKHSTDFCLSYLNDKILKSFDKSSMTFMILIDLQKAFDTIDHDALWENYTLSVFRNILLIDLYLIYPTDLFWLIWEIIFLNLHLYPVVYPKVLFWDLFCF